MLTKGSFDIFGVLEDGGAEIFVRREDNEFVIVLEMVQKHRLVARQVGVYLAALREESLESFEKSSHA